jgi:hypothetical protein
MRVERTLVPLTDGFDLGDEALEGAAPSKCKRCVDMRGLHIFVAEVIDVQDIVERHNADNVEPRSVRLRNLVSELADSPPLLAMRVFAQKVFAQPRVIACRASSIVHSHRGVPRFTIIREVREEALHAELQTLM